MSFKNVAINDGRVAGTQLLWNLITGTNSLEIADVFNSDLIAVIFQIGYPVATATSEAMLVNRHLEWFTD